VVPISVFFDGTTRTCECLAVVLRFVLRGFIQQRVAALRFLKYSTNAADLSRVIVNTISTRLRVPNSAVLAFGHDRASVNSAAYKQFGFLYVLSEDFGCWSHTLDNAGSEIDTPTLKVFLSFWKALIGHSKRPKILFRELVGKMPNSSSPTRWWSDFEIIKELFYQWSHVKVVLSSCLEEGVAPANCNGCLQSMQNPLLKVEMAAVVDAAAKFCSSGYFLEGDSLLATKAYDVFVELQAHVAHFAHPLLNIEAKGDPDMVAHGVQCVKPMFSYFTDRFSNAPELRSMVQFFKAARIFNPSKIADLAGEVENTLGRFRFISLSERSDLLMELPLYIAQANTYDPSPHADHALFWRQRMSILPVWSAAAFKIALFQPSSACVERVFSMVNNSLKDTQETALEDVAEGSIMKRYNNLQRAKMT